LAFGRPGHLESETPQLEEKLQFPRWRHLPPDGYLLGIQRTQPAAKVFGQVTNGRREFT
jgi:hypothetical protein